MSVIADVGLNVHYALPYLGTGTDFNLTSMVFNLALAATAGKLQPHIVIVTDGGDGNWGPAVTAALGLIVQVCVCVCVY